MRQEKYCLCNKVYIPVVSRDIWKEFARNATQSRVTLSQRHLFLLFFHFFSFSFHQFSYHSRKRRKKGQTGRQAKGGVSKVMEILRTHGDDGRGVPFSPTPISICLHFSLEQYPLRLSNAVVLRCMRPEGVHFDSHITWANEQIIREQEYKIHINAIRQI